MLPNMTGLYIHREVGSKQKTRNQAGLVIYSGLTQISKNHRFPCLLLFHLCSSFLYFFTRSLTSSTLFSCLFPSLALLSLLPLRYKTSNCHGSRGNSGVKSTETLYSYCPKQKAGLSTQKSHIHSGIRVSEQYGRLSVSNSVCGCLCTRECMFLAGEGAHRPLQLHSHWHCHFKVSIACHSGSQTLPTQSIHLCQGPLHPCATALLSPPLHNYPGNCGVIDCITCSQEALALFNKQLEYAPHVVGEKGEEHIGAEGDRRRTEKKKEWSLVQKADSANFPNIEIQI